MSGELVRRGFVYRKVESQCTCMCFCRPKWRKQYMVCKDAALSFYTSPESIHALYSLSLYGAACIFIQYPKTSKNNALEIVTPQYNCQICVESIEDTRQWALTIQKQSILASGGKMTLLKDGGQMNRLPHNPIAAPLGAIRPGGAYSPQQDAECSENEVMSPISNARESDRRSQRPEPS